MSWPQLLAPTDAIATSGWASPRSIGDKTGIHGALDFANALGDQVRAVASGKVLEAGRASGETGNRVLIQHDFGGLIIQSRYIHLEKIFVSAGQAVSGGDTIGTAGNSGVGGGIHLHLDIHVCGAAALSSYRATFGWPTTTVSPLIKSTGCTLVPAEPLVRVRGYRNSVVAEAAKYGIPLLGKGSASGSSGIGPMVIGAAATVGLFALWKWSRR